MIGWARAVPYEILERLVNHLAIVYPFTGSDATSFYWEPVAAEHRVPVVGGIVD